MLYCFVLKVRAAVSTPTIALKLRSNTGSSAAGGCRSNNYYRTLFKSLGGLSAICGKTSTEKWQLVAQNRKLFCFHPILTSRYFAMCGKFSLLPAKWKHRFACRRPNKLIYYTSPMFYERWLAKKIPTYLMLDSVLLFLTNIPHVTNVGLTENPTFLTWLMLHSLRIQHSSRD